MALWRMQSGAGRGVNISGGSGGVFFADHTYGRQGGGNGSSLLNPGGPGDGQPWRIHTVQEGETIWSISQKYAVSMEEIYEANPEIEWKWGAFQSAENGIPFGKNMIIQISEDGKAYRIYRPEIYPGQKIIIPVMKTINQ